MPHERLLLATAELKVGRERQRQRIRSPPCRGVEFIGCYVWLCAVAVTVLDAAHKLEHTAQGFVPWGQMGWRGRSCLQARAAWSLRLL